jgi:hypothetical protein
MMPAQEGRRNSPGPPEPMASAATGDAGAEQGG